MAPLRTDLPKPIIFAKTLKLVEEKGWQLVSDNIDLGEIEAIVTTPAFGFQDDVIIRIQADDADIGWICALSRVWGLVI